MCVYFCPSHIPDPPIPNIRKTSILFSGACWPSGLGCWVVGSIALAMQGVNKEKEGRKIRDIIDHFKLVFGQELLQGTYFHLLPKPLHQLVLILLYSSLYFFSIPWLTSEYMILAGSASHSHKYKQGNKMHNGKYKTEIGYEHRRKLFSLRSLTSHDLPATTVAMQKRSFDQLERSLNRDNTLEEQPVAQPVAVIPGFEEEAIQGKLWDYFHGRVEAVDGKVEKQQVNCREKHFWIVKQQVTQMQNTFTRQSCQLENVIKQKYKQIHGLFEEIKQERSLKVFSLSPKPKKSKKETLFLDNNERLISLKEHVQLIRNDVLSLELQLGKINQDAYKLKRQWTTFLKQILKGGHYLKDGMMTILQQMISVDFVPSIEDMPDVLDESSKKCLLQEYDSLKTNSKRTNRIPPLRLERSRILSEARQSLSQIAKKNLVREVYKDTQEFMANLMKQSDWRTTNITLPKINTSRKQSGPAWQENQRKRILFAYSGDDLIKARGILFGWKVQVSQ